MFTRVRSLFMSVLFISCFALLCQEKTKSITDMRDLELGMPRDGTLEALATHYRLVEEIEPPANPTEGFDAWNVFSGDSFVGEVVFNDGQVGIATIRMYSPDGGAPKLVDQLFDALYDQWPCEHQGNGRESAQDSDS